MSTVGPVLEPATMRVVIDPHSVAQSAMGNITGGIWFDTGSEGFPEVGWTDFVVVLLNWWIAELAALPAASNPRATACLDFMDGPLLVRVSAPLGNTGPWTAEMIRRGAREQVVQRLSISGEELNASLLEAARRIVEVCDAAGFEGPDVEALRVRTP